MKNNPYQNKIDHLAISLILVYRKILVYMEISVIGITKQVIPTYRYWIRYQYFRYTEQPYKAEF